MIEHHKHYNHERFTADFLREYFSRLDDKLNEIIRVVNELSVPVKKRPLLKELNALKKSRARLDVEINQISMELGDVKR